MIDKFTEQHIKATAKITDVLERYGLPLKRRGSGYVTFCPFHNDKHPSMSVNVKGNYCNCFACGVGADPVKLVREKEGVTYGDALRILAAMYNIPVEAQTAQRGTARRIPVIKPRPVEIEQVAPPTYTDPALMESSKRQYEGNPLFAFVASLFGYAVTLEALKRYNVGTARYKVCPQQGERCSVVFWQVDEAGNVRGGKIVPYDERTGKRIRGDRAVSWAHSATKLTGYKLQQCLFGQHLIAHTDRVNIVESEKTAILAALYTQGKLGVWVATGGKESRSRIVAAADLLRGKQVILYPDADGVAEWNAMRSELSDVGINARIGALTSKMDPESKEDVGDWIVERIKAYRQRISASPLPPIQFPYDVYNPDAIVEEPPF